MCTSEPHVKIVHNRIDLDYTAELIVNENAIQSKRYPFRWLAMWRGKAMLRRYLEKSIVETAVIIRVSDL
jgi:hypothetical protein